MVQVVSASHWDAKVVIGVKGIPGKLNPTGADEIDAGIEDFQDPHMHGDEEGRASTEDELREPLEARADALEKK